MIGQEQWHEVLAEGIARFIEQEQHEAVMHHELSDIIYDVLAIGPQNGQQTVVQHTFRCEAAVRFALGSALELVNVELVDVVLAHDDGRGVDEAAQRVEYNDVTQGRAVVVHWQAEAANVVDHTQHFAFGLTGKRRCVAMDCTSASVCDMRDSIFYIFGFTRGCDTVVTRLEHGRCEWSEDGGSGWWRLAAGPWVFKRVFAKGRRKYRSLQQTASLVATASWCR